MEGEGRNLEQGERGDENEARVPPTKVLDSDSRKVTFATDHPAKPDKESCEDAVAPRPFVSSSTSSPVTITAKHLDGRRRKDRR